MDMLINLMGRILPKCIRISNHHQIHFKYLTILFVNYTSIKVKKKVHWVNTGIKGVKKFLSFEHKRWCILYLFNLFKCNENFNSGTQLQFLLTSDMWNFSQIKSRLFSYIGIKESWFVWETHLEKLWWTLMGNTLV